MFSQYTYGSFPVVRDGIAHEDEVDFAARMAVEEERFPSTRTFVLKCLGVADASSVDAALEKKFGSFEWLGYDLKDESENEEEQEEAAQ